MEDYPLLKQLAIEIVELINLEKDDKVMDTKACARYLKLDPGTVRRLAKAGEIPHIKIGGTNRYHRDAIDKWLGV
jgi:excisionase family DNA binding protein